MPPRPSQRPILQPLVNSVFFSPSRLLVPPFFTRPFPCDIPHFVMTGKRPRWGQVLFFRLIGQKVQPKGMVIQKLPKFHNERILEMISVIPFLLPMALYFGRSTYHLRHRVNCSAFPWESGRLFLGERGKYKDRPKPRHIKIPPRGKRLFPPQGRGQCDGGTVCGFPHRV